MQIDSIYVNQTPAAAAVDSGAAVTNSSSVASQARFFEDQAKKLQEHKVLQKKEVGTLKIDQTRYAGVAVKPEDISAAERDRVENLKKMPDTAQAGAAYFRGIGPPIVNPGHTPNGGNPEARENKNQVIFTHKGTQVDLETNETGAQVNIDKTETAVTDALTNVTNAVIQKFANKEGKQEALSTANALALEIIANVVEISDSKNVTKGKEYLLNRFLKDVTTATNASPNSTKQALSSITQDTKIDTIPNSAKEMQEEYDETTSVTATDGGAVVIRHVQDKHTTKTHIVYPSFPFWMYLGGPTETIEGMHVSHTPRQFKDGAVATFIPEVLFQDFNLLTNDGRLLWLPEAGSQNLSNTSLNPHNQLKEGLEKVGNGTAQVLKSATEIAANTLDDAAKRVSGFL